MSGAENRSSAWRMGSRPSNNVHPYNVQPTLVLRCSAIWAVDRVAFIQEMCLVTGLLKSLKVYTISMCDLKTSILYN